MVRYKRFSDATSLYTVYSPSNSITQLLQGGSNHTIDMLPTIARRRTTKPRQTHPVTRVPPPPATVCSPLTPRTKRGFTFSKPCIIHNSATMKNAFIGVGGTTE
ncbi:hypothetical protein J6590_061865 [Homalodisca vitripennis]|nr:hypothetical protein J6590_061865 [Homalodisca vitripennis]